MNGMSERRRNLIGGGLLALLGIGAALNAHSTLHVGTVANMGPGFFPVVLGVCLALCGAGIAVFAVASAAPQGEMPRVRLRAVVLITLSVVVFALTVRSLGMVPAAFLLVLTAGLADPRSGLRKTLLLAAGLALVSWAIFIAALGMPLQAFAI